jgi:hypothetical protein
MANRADPRRLYREGTEALCAGNAGEACRLLEAVPAESRPREHRFALGRSYLELGRGAEASGCFEDLLRDPPNERGAHAHLVLLSAAALALAGNSAEARARLGTVPSIDPRLERAARALRKRIDEDARPEPRL